MILSCQCLSAVSAKNIVRVTHETPLVGEEENQDSDAATGVSSWMSETTGSSPFQDGCESVATPQTTDEIPVGMDLLVIKEELEFDRSSIHSTKSAPVQRTEKEVLMDEQDRFSSPTHMGMRIQADGSGFKG